ncbi:MBG domain-containing protein, partial [Pelotalea chapellei]
LSVAITYAGSATAPTAAGSYAVVATVSDANYTGTANGTLVIAKATPTITWAVPAPITVGTALSATQLNATANVPGSF